MFNRLKPSDCGVCSKNNINNLKVLQVPVAAAAVRKMGSYNSLTTALCQ